MSNEQPGLELDSVTKHFGGLHAVEDVNLRLNLGERRGILGPNGAGKTTLFHLITGVQGLRKMKMVMLKPLHKYKDVYDKAEKLLSDVNFWHLRDQEVRNLSHGEQRQLEIVLALASDPKVLLLDEPSAGLATGESHEMADFLKSLDPEIAILLIEYDLDVIFEVVSHISVLHYGEVLAEGPSDDIRNDPRVQEIYLGKAE